MIPREAWSPPVPDDVAALFRKDGLTLVGIADADAAPERETEFKAWLSEQRQGSMKWLSEHAELKYRPESLLPGCRSVLIVALNYYQAAPWARGENNATPAGARGPAGRIARYAWGRDYHKVIGKRLLRVVRALQEAYPEESFRSFTDATPLAERYFAERAGGSFTARNTLSISSAFGSWFLIGEILSTKDFGVSEPSKGRHGSCPQGCYRCIDVCPTGALHAPYRIDASKCISYLTIEHKGHIPEDLRPKIGTWLFGCDLCQEVCPLNVRAEVTAEEDFITLRAGDSQLLEEILAIETDDEYTARFAGSPLMRAKRQGLLRNAAIVAANMDAHSLRPLLERRAGDRNDVIAEAARWALSQLDDRAAPGRQAPPATRP